MPTVAFPASPSLNDEYTFSGRTWTFDGAGWAILYEVSTINSFQFPIPVSNYRELLATFATQAFQVSATHTAVDYI